MKKRRFARLLLVLVMMIAIIPSRLHADAASDPATYSFDIAEGDISIAAGTNANTLKVTYGNPQVTTPDFDNTQMITIFGTTVTNKIYMQAVAAQVTLDDVNIQLSGDNQGAFGMSSGALGNLTLTLVGDNTLKSGQWKPGLQVSWNGRITIQGTGSLSATGGLYCAGIGDRFQNGIINILSGTIYAYGGENGSGIGAGSNSASAAGDINILGGTVVATGYAAGAGIGPGYLSTAGNVKIMAEANVTAISDEAILRAIVTSSGSLTADSTAMILMANTVGGNNKAAGVTTGVYFKDSGLLHKSVTPSRFYRSVAFSVPSAEIYQFKCNGILQKNTIPSIDYTVPGAGLTVFNGLADEIYSIANLSNQTMAPKTEFYA